MHRRTLLAPVAAAVVAVFGLSVPAYAAAPSGSVGTATLRTPNASDYDYQCTINPGSATVPVYVIGRSWRSSDGTLTVDTPATQTGGLPVVVAGPAGQSARSKLLGTSAQTVTFFRDGPPSTAMQSRCLWYATPTTTTVLGKTATTVLITTGVDNTAPVAALTATPSSGVGPQPVTLSAAGSTDAQGNIATYAVNYGDGTSAPAQASPTFTHTYAAGTWTATVTVTDTGGLSSTATVGLSITANTAPTAVLAVTPQTGTAPLAASLDASGSTDAQNNIDHYVLDPGDGTGAVTQTTATLAHTYATAGSYTASVDVYDTRGAHTLATTVVTVTVPPSPPVAALSVTPTSGTAPLAVTADASGSTDPDGDIASYGFDWGDGTTTPPQPAATATHTYTTAGTVTVTVTVTDAGGRTGTATAGPVTVTAPPPPARFPGDPGPGKSYAGLNSGSQYNTVQAVMPHPFMVRRVYNGTAFGVPNITADKAAGRIPMVTWKYGAYSPGNVPQSAVSQVCTDLAAYGDWVIATPIFHEPTGDILGTTARAAYRSDQRNQVLTCRTMGVTNVAWASPYFEGPFGFTTGSGHSWTELYADCASGCDTTTPTFYTGPNRVYDLDGIDIYVSPTIDSRPFADQMTVVKNAMVAKGHTPLPFAVGELGINSAPDPTLRAGKMQAAWDVINGNPEYAAVAWWSTGGEEFCATNTATDPGCASQNVLASIVGDADVIHP